MTFVLALNLALKIGLTRHKLLTRTTRNLVIRSLEGLGEGDPTIPMGNLGNPPVRGETACHINDKPHAWCGSCGWTTTNSTKYYDKWSLNKSAFLLHNKHPLDLAKLDAKNSGQPKSKTKKPEGENKTHSGLSLATLGKHFARMKLEASVPTQANMAQVLKLLLQGKV